MLSVFGSELHAAVQLTGPSNHAVAHWQCPAPGKPTVKSAWWSLVSFVSARITFAHLAFQITCAAPRELPSSWVPAIPYLMSTWPTVCHSVFIANGMHAIIKRKTTLHA